MVKLVDALDSKSSRGNSVRVQVPPSVLKMFINHEDQMTRWLQIISIIFLASAFSFAQFDFDDDSGNLDSSEFGYEDDGDSFSGASTSSFDDDDFDTPQESSETGLTTATGNEWDSFSVEEMGLTQWEFQQAKEAGLTRDKLTKLVELGIRPTEYLQKPWEQLGVSEEDWLEQRTQGLEDSEIDRSYRNKKGQQGTAYLSILVPSLYQWKTNNVTKAVFMDALWVAGVGATTYLALSGESTWVWAMAAVAAVHIWSFADAFLSTQWENNPDANRFSFGIIPTFDKGMSKSLDKGVAGFMFMQF